MPDALPRPDFLQFAERCSLHKAGAEVLRDQGDVEMFATAERHARLLDQIAQWAKSSTEPLPVGHSFIVFKEGAQVDGLEFAKAHVRRLLAGESK